MALASTRRAFHHGGRQTPCTVPASLSAGYGRAAALCLRSKVRGSWADQVRTPEFTSDDKRPSPFLKTHLMCAPVASLGVVVGVVLWGLVLNSRDLPLALCLHDRRILRYRSEVGFQPPRQRVLAHWLNNQAQLWAYVDHFRYLALLCAMCANGRLLKKAKGGRDCRGRMKLLWQQNLACLAEEPALQISYRSI